MDQLAKMGPLAALSKLWNDLSPAQRVVVLSFTALSVVAVVLIGMALSKPRMSVLFSGLETEDAGAIAQKLGEQKIPYEVSADGSTIEVPSDQVYDLKLQMATQGLPQGGSRGFELFDKNNFGMTEFTEKLQYQRAIQGELTRTIAHLGPVMDARVHLVMPEDKLYASEQQPATASIVLKLRRGQPLTDEQIGGIVHLVASSVEGLKPQNITVLDSSGQVLSEATAGSSAGGGLLTSNQSKMKRQFESELSQNLQSMLARIVGPDKAVVRVSADMSFDQKETKSETYEPANTGQAANTQAGEPVEPPKGILISSDTKSETYKGAVIPPGGVPSGARNRVNNSTVGGDDYTRTESSAQYSVTKKIEQVVSAPGKVERLSVAVLVDDKVDPVKVAAIQEAVSAAAGIDTKTRNDVVTVQRMTFDTSTAKAEADEMAKASKAEMMQSLAKNGGAVLLLVAFLFALRMIIKQIKVQTPVPAEGPGSMSAEQLASVQSLIQSAGQPGPTDEQAGPAGEKYSTEQRVDGLPVEVSQSSPEDLAKLVRTWMAES